MCDDGEGLTLTQKQVGRVWDLVNEVAVWSRVQGKAIEAGHKLKKAECFSEVLRCKAVQAAIGFGPET